MKPKKSQHTSITGKPFYGTPAEYFLASRLPYARLTLSDRREILVNAFHEPLWVRGPNLPPAEMDPCEKVHAADILWTDHLYNDYLRHHEKRHIAKQWLEEFIFGRPASIGPVVGERERKRARA
jgi:hypothetical protein